MHIGTAWLLLHNYVAGVFCLQGLWMNSLTLITMMANRVWVGLEIIPPVPFYVLLLPPCFFFRITAPGIMFLAKIIKGELRNRFNIISEERVKFSEQNSENLMKIGWKIRKLWHFEVSQIFTKHFLTSRYEYANERVDDVIASLFAIYFVHKFLKNSIFCPNLW